MRRLLALLAVVLAAAGCSVGGGGREPYAADGCVRQDLRGRSVARVWNEALLNAIRRDVPAPTVHARNLFHVSAAMWDAWAAYDRVGDGYFVTEKRETDAVRAAREAAISYAAYRILLHRYSLAAGLEATFAELAATMESLCYRIDYVETSGDSPAALGNRIAAAVIAYGREDGSLEQLRYASPDYKPVNAPLVVREGRAEVRDPNRWQPLALDQIVAQNGVPIPGAVQSFIGQHWGRVRPFALRPSSSGLPIDPGPPPRLDDNGGSRYVQAALEVLRYSSWLDPADGVTIDISPAARGRNTLGANDGRGYDRNPVTGRPYAANDVRRGDFTRALTEYWADGPESETPPGHWNTIANDVSDEAGLVHEIGGRRVDRLEWDVKLYFALNGAVHDAAVAAWGVKGHYDSARPISMIRYLGGNGQSSRRRAASYHPRGLPLVPRLVELVTPESAAPGNRHAHLREYIGEVAVRSWRGPSEDPASSSTGVGWIRAVDWLPYQRPTFVSPAFAGFVSGHSAFSRAAAEVLTAATESPYFPGGIYEWKVDRGGLVNERGPTREVTLQWATYFDAADDAGISRLLGGIHITPDDLEGRKLGSICGKDAWALARRYFAGTAR